MDKTFPSANSHLNFLCNTLPTRRVGSSGNQQAAAYIRDHWQTVGLQVNIQPFDCIDWQDQGATLHIANEEILIHSGPYSLGCQITAEIVKARSVQELKNLDAHGKILLLQDDLCQEQLMPKQFPFYNPEHHQQLVALLEQKQPAAILAATGRNPELAGGMYPFPLIEDGDFHIPNAYLKDVDGAHLAQHIGKPATLHIRSERIPSHGENVIATAGDPHGKKIVLTAHLDAKDDTPGALDNATGVVILLLLAEMLSSYSGPYHIELVALNGEDHYSAAGEIEYLRSIQGKESFILFNINMDAVGYREAKTAYSFYNCPPELQKKANEIFEQNAEFIPGDAWYQGDHSIFIQSGIPAMALTSQQFMHLSTEITHTPKDKPELVDITKLESCAQVLTTIIEELSAQ